MKSAIVLGNTLKVIIAIFLVLLALSGCGEKTGKNYYECLFLMNSQANQNPAIATDICNQLHPPFIANSEELAKLDFVAHSDGWGGDRKWIEITNRTSNFVVTELIATFEGKENKIDVRYYAQVKPLSIGRTEMLQTRINGDFKFYISSVKGRPFK